MKKLPIVAIAASLLLIPIAVNAQPGETPTQPPPVAQTLVREGDFAIKLVDTLKIGTAENEAEAESMLSSTGISPRNGWIADYPLTPDIIGELQDAVGEAADSQRLPMGKDEALKAFQNLTAEMGLSLAADTRGEVAQNEPPRNYGEYSRPEVINNYYYNEGPPVVTYYPPPWDYSYMYTWAPYPFWCSGFFFPGFFILHDFHRVIIINKRVVIITNHFRDPKTRRIFTIDPVKRRIGRPFRVDRDIPRTRGFNSTEAKKAASSIFERSRERARSGNPVVPRTERGLIERNPISPKSSGRTEKQIFNKREGKTSTFDGRNANQASPPTVGRRMNRVPAETGSRDMGERTFSRQRGIESRGITGFNRPSGRIERSFTAPSVDSGRSFNAPLQGGGRSFSPPSIGGRGSFEAPQGGGRSGGFGRGGFSMGM